MTVTTYHHHPSTKANPTTDHDNVNDLTPEVKRAHARRRRDEERLKKLHSARLRNVGADIAGIEAQVREKQALARTCALESERAEGHQHDIRQIVARVEHDERVRVQTQARALRAEWRVQRADQRSSAQRSKAASTTHHDRPADDDAEGTTPVGIGAAQVFDGEDLEKPTRERLQALQIRSWNATLEREKHVAQVRATSDAMLEAVALETQVRLQCEHERQSSVRATQRALDNRVANAILVRDKRERECEERRQDDEAQVAELAQASASALLTEDRAQGRSVIAITRVRPDHWKGMTCSHVREILRSNEQLVREKKQAQECADEARVEALEGQRQMVSDLERQEWQARMARAQVSSDVRQTLAQQQLEAQERERRQAQLSTGKIESGFFDSFGKSYR